MFAIEARKFIESLLLIQKKIKGKGYDRTDQNVVNECRNRIQPLIEENRYETNERMARFWINHRTEIRYLIPTSSYKGFKALMAHFEYLDKDSKMHQPVKQLINS